MKKILFAIFFILTFNFSFTQKITLKVNNLNDSSAVLLLLSGEKFSVIQSITAIYSGLFQFNLENNHPGIYRLGFSNNKSLDFVFDNEDVEIESDAINISENLKVISSESNKIYYDFINLNKDYKTKTELLQLILARYPEADNYYQITKVKLNQVQEDYLYFVNVTAQINPNSFIAKYVKSSQLPVLDAEDPVDQQLNYLKSHALDNVKFSDADLINSDAFTSKSIEYLTYYRNPHLPMPLLEKEFQFAVDSILNKAKVSDIVYKHIVEYLLNGFKKFGFDNVINYIIDNYVIADDICLDEKLETTLERRINQNKLFKPGFIVPDIAINDSSGSIIKLSEIKAEKTLVIFYASWCPHCKDMLPQIYNLYKNQKEKKFEVIAISIDTSKTDWLNFIKTNKLDWLNVSDLKGWDGKAAVDYFIYATPTILLVDNDGVLIQTIINTEELKNYIN